MSTHNDIARLTADLANTTCPDAARRIRRELVQMGAAREQVARVTFVALNKVHTEDFTIFNNPYNLDQLRLVKEVKRVLAEAGWSGARPLHWGWAA